MAIPVTLPDARRQLQIDEYDVDRNVEAESFIADAAAWVEEYTGHILEARAATEQFAGFGRTQLSAWPVKADAVPVVTYTNAAGVEIPVTGVRMSISQRPARVVPWAGLRWPRVACDTTMTVTVRAGYEPDDVVPGNFRRAMLILISAYDADREGGDVFAKAEAAARRLCGRFRLRRL